MNDIIIVTKYSCCTRIYLIKNDAKNIFAVEDEQRIQRSGAQNVRIVKTYRSMQRFIS